MLDFTRHEDTLSLRLLVLHEDAERESRVLGRSRTGAQPGREDLCTIVSTKDDWEPCSEVDVSR